MTASFLGFDFFENNLNWKELIPLLIWSAIVMAGVILCEWARRYYANKIKISRLWQNYSTLVKEKNLTRTEAAFLRRLIQKNHIDNPSRIFLEQEHFEKFVSHLHIPHPQLDNEVIQKIREKLFGITGKNNERIDSTEHLIVGSKLLLEHHEHPGDMFWGDLVDVDPEGLVVVIHPNQLHYHALRIETELNVLAYVHSGNSVLFRTWIKAIVPGPRRMIVLSHSSLVYENKRPNSDERAMAPAARSSDRLNRHPSSSPLRPHTYH